MNENISDVIIRALVSNVNDLEKMVAHQAEELRIINGDYDDLSKQYDEIKEQRNQIGNDLQILYSDYRKIEKELLDFKIQKEYVRKAMEELKND